MLKQRLQTFVGLGECVCLLACREADLHWRLDAPAYEQLGELGVAVQRLLVGRDRLHQSLLGVSQVYLVVLQRISVEQEDWLGKHLYRQVDQAKLGRGESFHCTEQRVGNSYVIPAVLPISAQLLGSEVGASLPKGIDHLVTLSPYPIVLGQRSQATTNFTTMQRPAHAQGVEPPSRDNSKVPTQDSRIEHGVVRQD